MKLKDPLYVKDFLKEGIRFDGRKFDEFRKVEIETGVSENAEGSARVKLGNSDVISGVKLEIDRPFPDTPDKGIIIINAEFCPFSFEDFDQEDIREKEVELARVVDRAIRSSGMVSLEELCVKKGEEVWKIIVDNYILNHDGNLIDLLTLSTVVALLNTRFPRLENGKIIHEERTDKKLPITGIPLNITIAKVDSNYLVDPTRIEEETADCLLTVGIKDNKICSLQKRGKGGLTDDEIKKIIELAIEKYKELRKVVENSTH